jgi:uncharacterized membrane protein YkvA (DUF1232 family)
MPRAGKTGTTANAGKTGNEGKKRRKGGGRMKAAASLLVLMPLAAKAPTYGRLVWELLLDGRTPMWRKGILGAGAAYLVSPVDLVPDWLPLVGQVDDLVVALLALEVFLDGVPDELLDEKLELIGVSREAFERDIAQLRTMVPKPLRKTVQRVPGALDAAARAAQTSGLPKRLRGWINKEGSLA